MRIFITGGSGFIGKPLCQALAGHELMILSRNPSRLQLPLAWQPLDGDLANLPAWHNQLAAFQPEACLHLAWANLPDYSMPVNNANFNAGLDLFQCLLKVECKRIVVTGTCFEYGNLTGCLTEGQVPTTQGLFAAFKAAQRLVGQSLFARSGTSFLWTRPFFVYGPGQRPTSLIPSVARNLSSGTLPDIRTPNVIQDFIHVNDVAQGLALLATSDAPAGVYNLGSGKPVIVRNVVNLIARLLRRSTVFPETGDTGEGFWANMDRMHTYTGWTPSMALDEGVRSALATLNEPMARAG